MKAFNRNFVILFMFLNSLMVLGQSKSPTQPKVLDNAVLRITYAFSQQAEKQREKVTLTDTMTLDAGNNWSVYYNLNKILKDSLNKKRDEKLFSSLKSVSVFKDEAAFERKLESKQEPSLVVDESRNESARLYKNRLENQIILIDNGPSEGMASPIRTYLRVTEDFNLKDWKISEETSKVLDYVCMKATLSFRGRNYIAWFTIDIPVNDGPWKFFGLPGMIMKVASDDNLFSFEAIGIQKLDDVIIDMSTNRKFVDSSLKQFNDYRKNRFKRVSYTFMNGGNMEVYAAKNPISYNSLEINEQ